MNRAFRADVVSLVILGLMAAASIYAWTRVPNSLPIQWGFGSNAISYGGRLEALAVLPGIAFVIFAKYALIPVLSKRSAEDNGKTFQTISLILLTGLDILHLGLVAFYLGYDVSVTRVGNCAVGIILVGVGNVLPRLDTNIFAGLRLPWHLLSERAWRMGQRLGGRCFVLSGLVLLLGTLFTSSDWVLLSGLVLLLVSLVAVGLHTFSLWRKETEAH